METKPPKERGKGTQEAKAENVIPPTIFFSVRKKCPH